MLSGPPAGRGMPGMCGRVPRGSGGPPEGRMRGTPKCLKPGKGPGSSGSGRAWGSGGGGPTGRRTPGGPGGYTPGGPPGRGRSGGPRSGPGRCCAGPSMGGRGSGGGPSMPGRCVGSRRPVRAAGSGEQPGRWSREERRGGDPAKCPLPSSKCERWGKSCRKEVGREPGLRDMSGPRSAGGRAGPCRRSAKEKPSAAPGDMRSPDPKRSAETGRGVRSPSPASPAAAAGPAAAGAAAGASAPLPLLPPLVAAQLSAVGRLVLVGELQQPTVAAVAAAAVHAVGVSVDSMACTGSMLPSGLCTSREGSSAAVGAVNSSTSSGSIPSSSNASSPCTAPPPLAAAAAAAAAAVAPCCCCCRAEPLVGGTGKLAASLSACVRALEGDPSLPSCDPSPPRACPGVLGGSGLLGLLSWLLLPPALSS